MCCGAHTVTPIYRVDLRVSLVKLSCIILRNKLSFLEFIRIRWKITWMNSSDVSRIKPYKGEKKNRCMGNNETNKRTKQNKSS